MTPLPWHIDAVGGVHPIAYWPMLEPARPGAPDILLARRPVRHDPPLPGLRSPAASPRWSPASVKMPFCDLCPPTAPTSLVANCTALSQAICIGCRPAAYASSMSTALDRHRRLHMPESS